MARDQGRGVARSARRSQQVNVNLTTRVLSVRGVGLSSEYQIPHIRLEGIEFTKILSPVHRRYGCMTKLLEKLVYEPINTMLIFTLGFPRGVLEISNRASFLSLVSDTRTVYWNIWHTSNETALFFCS